MAIKSNKVEVSTKAIQVFDFLKDLNNLNELMPQDRISDWQSDEETCSFQINGLSKISMKRAELVESKLVKMDSHGKNPFDFTLSIKIEDGNNENSNVQIEFDGKMNTFMKMMVEKPLTNFFNMLASSLQAKYA